MCRGRVGVSHVDIWGRALQAEGTVRSKALSRHIVGKEQEGSHFKMGEPSVGTGERVGEGR